MKKYGIKSLLLDAIEDAAYFTEVYKQEKGIEIRETLSYFNGRKDVLLIVYQEKDFEKSEEALSAKEKGIKTYYDEIANQLN